jgi:glutamyl/glutaminyl-tRNA synthetase
LDHSPIRYRLAPTPSGFLHVGNAFNFVLNAALARVHPQGRLLLRIDDLDADRKRPVYLSHIFQTLDALGITWDEGPSGPDDFERNWSQRHRLDIYQAALQQLRSLQLLFPCQLSRQQMAAIAPDYPLELRHFESDFEQPDTAWRANTPLGAPLPAFVVRRRDGVPAYQLASICDDLHFGITHVVRGSDLIPSTQAQQWLAQAAGWTDFARIQFEHHPLMTDPSDQKLSKSTGAVPIDLGAKALIFQQVAGYLNLEGEVCDFLTLVEACKCKYGI